MKIIEVEKISKYLVGAIPIGFGTTAICFLMLDGNVIKVYYDNYLKEAMMSKIKIFEVIDNDTFVTPTEILIKENRVVAQIYPYVKASTLYNINKKYTFAEIISAYDILVSDTKKISDKKFVLNDIHDKNILFNGRFYVIDLDQGNISNLSEKNIFNLNMRNLNDVILYSLLDVNTDQILEFSDSRLQKLYSECFLDVELFRVLLEYLQDLCVTVDKKKIKKIEYIKTINSYYKY